VNSNKITDFNINSIGIEGNYDITDAPAVREDFIRAVNLEREKYDKYVKDISNKLDVIHGTSKGVKFWESVTGFVLLMHISNCRRVYEYLQTFNPNKIDVSIAIQDNLFKIPENQEEYRDIYEVSEVGDVQIYSQYISLFHNSLSDSKDYKLSTCIVDIDSKHSFVSESPSRLNRSITGRIKRYFKKPSVVVKQAVIAIIRNIFPPTMLLIECYWKISDKQSIQLKSFGKIIFDNFSPEYALTTIDSESVARKSISVLPEECDRFDEFFYYTLRWAAPETWIERFIIRYSSAKNFIDRRKKLKFIVNESLGENASLLMAVGREKSITAIHTEHNYLQHQFIGNTVWLNLKKVDTYLSLGWRVDEYYSVIPTGSNFNWYIKPKMDRNINILFVSGVALQRMPLTSSGYAFCGENNAKRYLKITYEFLDNLSSDCLGELYYKDYPNWRKSKLCTHKAEDTFLNNFRNRINFIDQDDIHDTVELISSSRLVIVNYLSTAYLQALVSNIPSIILYDVKGYFLTNEQKSFYDELVSVGIFHVNSIDAANFVNNIVKNPCEWWFSSDVQSARNNFISKNFGETDALHKYLLSMI
jgi:putative transferase (TIGR04331 family)